MGVGLAPTRLCCQLCLPAASPACLLPALPACCTTCVARHAGPKSAPQASQLNAAFPARPLNRSPGIEGMRRSLLQEGAPLRAGPRSPHATGLQVGGAVCCQG